ncbi:GntR family transcriptional regulator [Acidaminobacter sp. JC074]|uniref:GntR family transcriptional regulator n=1 Tax=Acidaminobacter sp. JC074 TaxID=2530199 RepID=UPI001F0FAB49|nr:GntR family transcriptional regulator [Acidaminobacter sp. JC074]MCH4886914.1 GntR family transcriptional regulator [Acidaminobacter sp. JC074]
MNKIDIRNYKPLGEIVFDYLKNAIISGELKPGERLMEIAIAEQLGVSRTPVREAIRKLEKEKFIEMVPRKGAYVSSTSLKDMLDVLEVRKLLEGFATELAAERMTDEALVSLLRTHKAFLKALDDGDTESMVSLDNEFHDMILQASDNSKLIEIATALTEQVQRYRLSYFTEVNNFDELREWHKKIYDAIEKKDAKKAGEVAKRHVELIEKAVVTLNKNK